MIGDSAAALRVVSVEGDRRVKDWLDVPVRVFADDPVWIRPLNAIERKRISPQHQPLYAFGQVALFIAYRGDRAVGRISAHVNYRYLDHHKDFTGHFGFFDCLDDEDAARALLDAAGEWLRSQGMTRMVGPLSFTMNEECGCLIQGFETPPSILMGHARPFTAWLLESVGMNKEVDLFTYRLDRSQFGRFEGMHGLLNGMSDVSVRKIDFSRFDSELDALLDVFNDSWSENWGFVPLRRDEIHRLADALKPLLNSDTGRFLMVDGEPAGVMLWLPDINETIASFSGRLLPFNWLKLRGTLKRRNYGAARLMLMGLKRKHQSSPRAGALFSRLVAELLALGGRYEVDYLDLGWVLETNQRVVELATAAAGPPAKIYRIYSMPL